MSLSQGELVCRKPLSGLVIMVFTGSYVTVAKFACALATPVIEWLGLMFEITNSETIRARLNFM